MQNLGYDTKRTYTQEHGDLAMNSNVVGFIEDIVGQLGDSKDWVAEECAEKLFALIKPFIEEDIIVGDEYQ
jgi:hypothetical protein